ncbi:MAG: hypothetical protein LBS09_07200 [Bacteroidales bacterium]|jgi:hypothetical protein|nr:hypothetical protein [Bacteroidales bacterium]
MKDLCSTRKMNMSAKSCDTSLGVPAYLVFCPIDAKITLQQSNGIYALLQEKLRAADASSRWYLTPKKVNQATDSSSEAQVVSLADGTSWQVDSGSAIFMAEWKSELCFDRMINQLNGYSGGAYVITLSPAKRLIGQDDGNGNLIPFSVNVSVSGGGFQPTGTTPNLKQMTVDFGNKLEMQSAASFFPFAARDNITLLRGLTDLLTRVVSTASLAAKLQLVTDCEEVNVYAQYKTQLSDTDVWKATNVVTGAAETIASVTAADADSLFTVRLSSAGTYEIGLAGVDVLTAAGIIGFESVPVEAVIPA